MEFPVDEIALNAIKHALGGAYTVDPDGTYHLVGADFSFQDILNFYSGYDSSKLQQMKDEDGYDIPDWFEYPDPIFSCTDVIRALIAEVERLRNDHPSTS
jgi:hypothetical protein